MTDKSLPTFSICIPNYNYGHYIGETIESVLSQNYQQLEIVIADNASTDNSIKIIESFHDDRIQLHKNRYNIGFSPNLQKASSHARNDFLILLSSDDRMKSEALSVYQTVIKKEGGSTGAMILFSQADVIDENGDIIPDRKLEMPKFYDELESRLVKLSNGLSYLIFDGRDVLREVTRRLGAAGPFLTHAYPRKLYDVVEGYNNVHLTDPDTHFSHKILSRFPKVIWINKSLFEYRVHNSNQLSLQKKQTSIKKPIDKYLYTLEISESLLADLGLTRSEITNTFIYKYCINDSFHYLARGSYLQAYKGITFALTTYPLQTLQVPRAYVLAGLLVLGPLAPLATRFLRKVYRFLGGSD